jgi:hypothetical protein
LESERERESEPETAEILQKKTLTRTELMVKASEVIDLLHARTTARAFRARKDDTQRLAFARATVQAVQAYAGLLKDSELDDLAARLAAIEQRRT